MDSFSPCKALFSVRNKKNRPIKVTNLHPNQSAHSGKHKLSVKLLEKNEEIHE